MLSTPDTQKLAKLLGMLGSVHDGEALSAARKAHQLVSRNGATWSDVIIAPGPERDTLPTIEHHVGRKALVHHAMKGAKRGKGSCGSVKRWHSPMRWIGP